MTIHNLNYNTTCTYDMVLMRHMIFSLLTVWKDKGWFWALGLGVTRLSPRGFDTQVQDRNTVPRQKQKMKKWRLSGPWGICIKAISCLNQILSGVLGCRFCPWERNYFVTSSNIFSICWITSLTSQLSPFFSILSPPQHVLIFMYVKRHTWKGWYTSLNDKIHESQTDRSILNLSISMTKGIRVRKW